MTNQVGSSTQEWRRGWSVVLAAAGIFNILFFVYPAPLVSAATAAAKSLF